MWGSHSTVQYDSRALAGAFHLGDLDVPPPVKGAGEGEAEGGGVRGHGANVDVHCGNVNDYLYLGTLAALSLTVLARVQPADGRDGHGRHRLSKYKRES